VCHLIVSHEEFLLLQNLSFNTYLRLGISAAQMSAAAPTDSVPVFQRLKRAVAVSWHPITRYVDGWISPLNTICSYFEHRESRPSASDSDSSDSSDEESHGDTNGMDAKRTPSDREPTLGSLPSFNQVN
jgi:hypothetical protein